MPVTPTGIMSLPIDRARRLVASTPTWQAWTAAADYTAALDRVAVMAAEPDLARPFAVVADSDDLEVITEGAAAGGGDTVRDRGELLLIIEAAVTDGLDHADAAYEFRNNIGAMLEEMASQSGGEDEDNQALLWLRRVRIVDPPMRAHPDIRKDEGDFYQVTLGIEYGVDA